MGANPIPASLAGLLRYIGFGSEPAFSRSCGSSVFPGATLGAMGAQYSLSRSADATEKRHNHGRKTQDIRTRDTSDQHRKIKHAQNRPFPRPVACMAQFRVFPRSPPRTPYVGDPPWPLEPGVLAAMPPADLTTGTHSQVLSPNLSLQHPNLPPGIACLCTILLEQRLGQTSTPRTHTHLNVLSYSRALQPNPALT